MRALLVTFALLASGCLAHGSVPEERAPFATSVRTAEVAYEPIPSEAGVAPGAGAIHGLVLDPWGEGFPDAPVALLGTPHFARTDDVGRFGFAGLAPGRYVVRIDVESYEGHLDEVHVRADHTAQYTARLEFRADVVASRRPHVHDLWEGQTRKDVVNASFQWPYTGAKGAQACYTLNNNPHFGGCLVEIPLTTPIPPGTSHMELSASWKVQDHVTKLTFWYWTAQPLKGPVPTVDVANGATKTIAIPPNATDHGHATFTVWRLAFELHFVAAQGAGFNQGELIQHLVAPFHIRYTAIKGDLWPEPAHPRPWASGPRLVLADNITTRLSENVQYDRDPQNRQSKSGAEGNPYFVLPGKALVPPGTTRLDVTLFQDPGNPAVQPILSTKTLAFRTGLVNRFKATMDDLRVETPVSADAARVVYRLRPTPNETDSHYSTVSNWLFLPANEGKERDPKLTMECPVACGGITLRLVVVAVNENYVADYAAGRV